MISGIARKHKIVLKGALTKFGKEHYVAGFTVPDCVRGLVLQNKELGQIINDGYFQIKIKNKYNKKGFYIKEEELGFLLGNRIPQTIEIIPVIQGAGGMSNTERGGFTMFGGAILTFVGAILIATGVSATVGVALVTAGVGLIFTGIATMLAPTPEKEKQEKDAYAFTGPKNTIKQGVPVPLAYGYIGVGSVIVSQGIIQTELGSKVSPFGVWTSNSIHQVSTYTSLDLISEGIIEGFENIGEDIYFDNAKAKEYENTNIIAHNGNRDVFSEGGISDLHPEVMRTIQVGHELQEARDEELENPNKINRPHPPYTIIITNPDVDYVLINLNSNGFLLTNGENGKKHALHFSFDIWKSDINEQKAVELYVNGQNAWMSIEDNKTSVTMECYINKLATMSIKVDISDLDRKSARKIEIQRKDNNYRDNDDSVQSNVTLSSYVEVTEAKLLYRDRAVVQLSLKSNDFEGNVPERIYVVKGIRIKVPNNYDPINHTYTGIWDGTFKYEWSNNPVWVFYDILTNNRYGLGREISEHNIDKWSLYEAAQYCDELVSDGKGGTEPRFTFNGVINSQESAYELIHNIAGVFRAMVYVGAGTVFISQDAPCPITKTFGKANVINGIFNYEGTAGKARHTAVEVSWINPDNFWQTEVELYEDDELIIKHGLNIKQVTALGCTSRGQAIRIAKHIIYTEEYETDTVSFEVGLADCDVRPGDVIYVADEMIQGERLFGRIKEVTEDECFLLDYPVRFQAHNAYEIIVTDDIGKIHQFTIQNPSSETDEIRVNGRIPDNIFPNAAWCIISTAVNPRKFRVLSVAEKENRTYTITALLHYSEKYAYIDESIKFEPKPISISPTGELQSVTSMSASPYIYNEQGVIKTGVELNWTLPSDARISSASLSVILPGGNDTNYQQGETRKFPLVTDTTLKIEDVGIGKLTVEVKTYSNITKSYSKSKTYVFELQSPYDEPPEPNNLKIETNNSIISIKWNKPAYSYDLTYEYYLATPEGTDDLQSTTAETVAYAKVFGHYPADCKFYVRSVNAIGLKSDFAEAKITVHGVIVDIDSVLDKIDKHMLTDELRQEIGIDGTLDSISESLLRATLLINKVQTASETALAFAIDGISAKIKEGEEVTANKFTELEASIGVQLERTTDSEPALKPDGINDITFEKLKIYQWYDGTNGYPLRNNPFFDKEKDITRENYPYLPVFPSESTFANLTETTAKIDSAITSKTDTLEARLNDSISKVEVKAVTAVDKDGTSINSFTVKTNSTFTTPEGNTVNRIAGFGLADDGSNSAFGVMANSFYILDPEYEVDNNFNNPAHTDKYIFYADKGTTYIGSTNTVYKGDIKSLSLNYNSDNSYSGNGFYFSSKSGSAIFHSDSNSILPSITVSSGIKTSITGRTNDYTGFRIRGDGTFESLGKTTAIYSNTNGRLNINNVNNMNIISLGNVSNSKHPIMVIDGKTNESQGTLFINNQSGLTMSETGIYQLNDTASVNILGGTYGINNVTKTPIFQITIDYNSSTLELDYSSYKIDLGESVTEVIPDPYHIPLRIPATNYSYSFGSGGYNGVEWRTLNPINDAIFAYTEDVLKKLRAAPVGSIISLPSPTIRMYGNTLAGKHAYLFYGFVDLWFKAIDNFKIASWSEGVSWDGGPAALGHTIKYGTTVKISNSSIGSNGEYIAPMYQNHYYTYLDYGWRCVLGHQHLVRRGVYQNTYLYGELRTTY